MENNRGGEKPLIKVIWCLIGCGEVCVGAGGFVLEKKMTVQGQQRYDAVTCTATADNPPSPTGNE